MNQVRWSGSTFCVIMCLLGLLGSDGIAQTAVSFPLQAGERYYVEFPNTSGVFTLVTPPDRNDWAVVNIEDGFTGSRLQGLRRVGLNLGQAILLARVSEGRATSLSIQANKDAIINDLNNLAAHAYQFKIRPSSMGGGQGSYRGYSIPSKLTRNENGVYQAMGGSSSVRIVAKSAIDERNTITVYVDSDGRLGNWSYEGDFR